MGEIKGSGIFQADLYTFLNNTKALVNELRTDHATYKTAVDELNTLTDELRADHATIVTLQTELIADHAAFKTAADAQKAIMGDMSLSAAGLTLGSGDPKKLKITNTVVYINAGLFKSKSTAEVAFTATTHDIADGSSAFFVVSLDGSGTVTLTKGADDAALSTITVPAGETVIGYFTLAANSAIFNATTDDLSAGHITDVYTDAAFLEQSILNAPDTLSASGIATIDAGEATAGPATITESALALTGL